MHSNSLPKGDRADAVGCVCSQANNPPDTFEGEESISGPLGSRDHMHLWTVRCRKCGRVTVVRTLGCNCRQKGKT